MQPAMVNQIPIWIKNTFNPSFKGTVIHAKSSNGKMIKGISSMNGVSLIKPSGQRLLGVSRRFHASVCYACA
jgi:aspartokinase/homoserine dehydrogenase 1